jgi:hypothetical protein
VQLELQALKVTRAIKVMSVLRVQLELKATRAIKAIKVLRATGARSYRRSR